MFLVTCRLFELYGRESGTRLLAKELPRLQGVGPQKCISFSVDGSKFATGGVVSNNNNPINHYHMVSSPSCLKCFNIPPMYSGIFLNHI